MGKPGTTDWIGNGRVSESSARLNHAEAVLGELSHGRTVSAEDRTRAEKALLDLLWSGNPSETGRARNGLLRLSGHGTPADRVRWAAEAAAAGKRGIPLFDALLKSDERLLSREERASVQTAMERSAEETLRVLASLLQKTPGKEEEAPGKGRSLPDIPNSHNDKAILPRKTPGTIPQARLPGDGDGRMDGLMNRDLPLPQRIALLKALGGSAVSFLLGHLASKERGEEAQLFLTILGREPQFRRTLHVALRQMKAKANSEIRTRIEPILRDIERHARGARDDEPGARVRPRDPEGGTTLLERALSLCDTPTLLLAATGRETTAIRMTLVRLGELRGALSSGDAP